MLILHTPSGGSEALPQQEAGVREQTDSALRRELASPELGPVPSHRPSTARSSCSSSARLALGRIGGPPLTEELHALFPYCVPG